MKTSLILSLSLLIASIGTAYGQPEAQGEKADSLIKTHAPTDSDAAVELVEYSGSGISVKYPSGWELNSNVQKPQVMHVKAMGGKVNASVTVQDLPEGTTLEEYRDATAHDILVDAKDLSPKKLAEESTHLGEMPAWKLIYSVTLPKTEPAVSAKQTLYVSVKDNRGYLLCCTAFDALPGKFDTIFRSMADSIKAAKIAPAAKNEKDDIGKAFEK